MEDEQNKKIKPLTVVYTVVVLIVAYILVIGVLIYGFGANNKIIQKTADIIPYPAAIVGGKKIVTVDKLSDNLQSVKKFYENQDFSKIGMRVDFSTEDGKKRLKIKEKELLNKMIEDKAIEMLARENGIKITSEAVDQNVDRKLQEYGTEEEVKSRLANLYGWTLDDFKKKVVRPALYGEGLEKLVMSQNKDDFAQAAREKINQVKSELDGGKDFTEAANTYSDGATASSGGELGWFKKDQLIAEVADVAFSLEKNRRSDIIESALGYHIIELEDKKAENGEDIVEIRQIFTRKKIFADWLGEQIKDMKIFIPLKGYYWDSQKGTAEFKDEKIKEFEKDLMKNFQGDASIIF